MSRAANIDNDAAAPSTSAESIRDCLRMGGCAFWIICCAITCGCNSSVTPVPVAPVVEPVRPPHEGLERLREQPADRFVPSTLPELPKIVQEHLEGAMELFQPKALPFAYAEGVIRPIPRPHDAKVRVFTASDKSENDLVELTWQYRKIPLRWLIGLNIRMLEFPLAPFQSDSGDDEVACLKVQEFCEDVLQLEGFYDYNRTRPYQIRFHWPKALENGVEFTSNSDRDFLISEWQNRVDILIRNGHVKLVTYHKPTRSTFFGDGSRFFPEDFRQSILEQMRAESPANSKS